MDGAIGTTRDNLLNTTENPNLKSAINELYRPGASIGSGSTADALKYEKATGILLSRTGHTTKALGSYFKYSCIIWQDIGNVV